MKDIDAGRVGANNVRNLDLSETELEKVLLRYGIETGSARGLSPIADKLRELHGKFSSDHESPGHRVLPTGPSRVSRNTLNTMLWSVVVLLVLVLTGIVISLFF